MKINSLFSPDSAFLSSYDWDIAFCGEPIDERGKISYEFVNKNAKKAYLIKYLPKSFKININNEVETEIDDISNSIFLNSTAKVILDSTTLGFSEMLIICQFLIDNNVRSIQIMYLEPLEYKKKQENEILLNRDFELSIEVIGYEAIPGHALSITNEIPQKVVFLCGFESERIDRAFEDSQIVSQNCSCIFGVPAISSGWEMDSFANNISVLKERKLNRDISFCGATNPESIIKKLEDYYAGLEEDGQMFIVPLATKPMNIGACLFLLTKPKEKVAVLYDHPRETTGKGINVANWHLYNIIV